MSTFDQDWVIARGLGGLTVEDELERLRLPYESKLRKARNAFLDKLSEAETAIDGLNAAKQDFAPEPLITDDVLGAAAVELKERAAEFHRKDRAEEAFRLRHGLTRSAEEG